MERLEEHLAKGKKYRFKIGNKCYTIRRKKDNELDGIESLKKFLNNVCANNIPKQIWYANKDILHNTISELYSFRIIKEKMKAHSREIVWDNVSGEDNFVVNGLTFTLKEFVEFLKPLDLPDIFEKDGRICFRVNKINL